MALLKFRVYVEEDNGVYRDIVVKTTQNFHQLHLGILTAFGFDQKHQATFFRSNDSWQRGREISLEKYDKTYKTEPLLMEKTIISTEIRDTNQHFIYEYDFEKNWVFMLELIGVSKEDNPKVTYPLVSRVEGIGPQQYGLKNMLSNQFVDIEEKYDLNKGTEGFGEEGEVENQENEDNEENQEETQEGFDLEDEL